MIRHALLTVLAAAGLALAASAPAFAAQPYPLNYKTFDLSANPYLAIGALIAAGLAGLEQRLELPPEFPDDPAGHPPEELEERGVHRLPESLSEAVGHLEKSDVLREAMGSTLYGAFLAVRRAEIEAFEGQDPEAIAAAHRWRY